MKRISLNGEWSVKGKPQCREGEWINIAGEVPGCVQLDMSRAGILPEDLYFGENITETEKYEDYEWWYTRTFDAPEERKNVFLVFRAVDCVAEYFLNGVLIGSSDNMFVPHEFEVGKYLKDGENELTVHISSPIIAAHNYEYDISAIDIRWSYHKALNTAVRRAPHTYGWDIMPRAVTSGIWRDVYLEVRDDVRFTQLFVDTFTNDNARLCFDTASLPEDYHGIEIEIEGACADSRFKYRFAAPRKSDLFVFSIPNKKLWWPYGYGEANVYDMEARIYREGELIHTTKTQFGVRSVELDRTDATDGKNGRFRFLINGVEVMCKGSNWVPLDAFHCRDASRYADALALVKDIGCNILRCWGGNVYEDHEFFDFCDRNGVMIWQDFAMACNNYPKNGDFLDKMHDEASKVIKEYRHHPSIILWSGDNEVDQMCAGLGMRPSLNKITREVLPDAVYRHDVGRPYLASSPYIPDETFDKMGRAAQGSPEDHLWGARDYFKSDFYKNAPAHFVSEMGYHGCPSLESIKKFISPDKVWPYENNSEWILHSADQNGNDGRVMLMHKQVRQLFGEIPTDPEEYITASQLSQAEAKKFFIEHMRIGRPTKCGIIWWNLLDGWPQMSDAVVDYYYDKKIAYRYIKRSQAPFAVAVDEIQNWGSGVFALNDTLTEKRGKIKITDAETGEVMREFCFTAPKNASTRITTLPLFYSDHKMLIIDWELEGGECGRNHFLVGYPPFDLKKYLEWAKKYEI